MGRTRGTGRLIEVGNSRSRHEVKSLLRTSFAPASEVPTRRQSRSGLLLGSFSPWPVRGRRADSPWIDGSLSRPSLR